MKPIETGDIGGGIRWTVYVDPDPLNPREEWDNGTIILAWHRNAWLGDGKGRNGHRIEDGGFNLNGPEHARELFTDDDGTPRDPADVLGELAGSPVLAYKPLYLYEHSGMTVSTGPFGDRWDSGQVGFVFVTEESRKVTGTPDDQLDALIESDVAVFDAYLRGDVYGYTVERVTTCDHGDEHADVLDSVWGYIETDGIEYVKGEAIAAAEWQRDHGTDNGNAGDAGVAS